jgi:hypothetical protein
LQKHLSGFNSPAISSPSCEIKNELSFPPLPATSNPQQQQQQTISQPTQQLEVAKGPPKGLSDLEEQLSKIHQKPFIQQQQQSSPQPHPSYSEAVRQSPTTVQQQFPLQTVVNQSAGQLQQPPVVLTSTPSPVVSATIVTPTPSSAQKVSRFQVSKVEEQKAAAAAAVKPLLLSPEIEVNSLQQPPSLPIQMSVPQSSQAQSFFQQHQGGVVSVKQTLCLCLFLRSMPVYLLLMCFKKLFFSRDFNSTSYNLLLYTPMCGLYSFLFNPFLCCCFYLFTIVDKIFFGFLLSSQLRMTKKKFPS